MSENLVYLLLAAMAGYLVIRLLLNSRPAISAEDARIAIENGSAVLVDVREPAEWTSGVASPAVLLPLSDLRGARTRWQPFLEKNRDRKILLYCQSGARSGMAAARLRAEGCDAVNFGGLFRWKRQGLPTRRG